MAKRKAGKEKRKRTEEERGALREAEAILEAIPDIVAVIDTNWRVVKWNRIAEKIVGYPPEEAKKKHVLEFIAEEDREVIVDGMSEVFEKGYSTRKGGVLAKLLTKSGKKISYAWSGALLKNEKGEVIGFAAVGRDITAIERAEEELRESEKKYRTLYETIRDGIAGGPMDGRITECNQGFADMLGYSKDELRNLTYQQITPKRWHRMEAKIVKEQILKRGYSDEYEKEYIRKDGTVFPISAKVWLRRDEDGKPIGMWGIVRDITERKKHEIDQLKRERVSLATEILASRINVEFRARVGSEELGLREHLTHLARLATTPAPRRTISFLETSVCRVLEQKGVKVSKKRVQKILRPVIKGFLRTVFTLERELGREPPSRYKKLIKTL